MSVSPGCSAFTALLKVLYGVASCAVFVVRAIGRDEECLPVTFGQSASLRHCRLSFRGSLWWKCNVIESETDMLDPEASAFSGV